MVGGGALAIAAGVHAPLSTVNRRLRRHELAEQRSPVRHRLVANAVFESDVSFARMIQAHDR